MPAKSEKQANTARLAGAVKSGEFPASKAGPAVKSMAQMSMKKLKDFMKTESLTIEQKKKLILGLKRLKQKLAKENSMTLSPQEPMNLEEEAPNAERKVIAQKFTKTGNYDTIVNNDRGIQFSPKELDAIAGFEKVVAPTVKNNFFVKFEIADDFGNNTVTTVKKHRRGNQFVFTSYEKHDTTKMEPEPPVQTPKPKVPQPKPAGQSAKPRPKQTIKPPKGSVPATPSLNEENGETDTVIISNTVPFTDEIKGADILSDFLRSLKL